VSEACWDLLRSLLEFDAARRPTAAEALEHCWLCEEAGTKAVHGTTKARANASTGKSTRAGGA
jgi:serine/threonine protein kinase